MDVTPQRESRGDAMPPDRARIEVRVGENAVGELAGRYTKYEYGRLLHESVVIGAWVALWRPLEILLYDWWPILGEVRLFDRLGAMQVQVGRE